MAFSGVEWTGEEWKELCEQNKMACSQVEWNNTLQNRKRQDERGWNGKEGRMGRNGVNRNDMDETVVEWNGK